MTVSTAGGSSAALRSVRAECPAFAEGCPYKSLFGGQSAADLAGACPAFEGGCPFKDADDVGTIASLLKTVPTTHLRDGHDGKGDSAKILQELLVAVHSASESMKATVGECPIFSASCPFKTVTSGGSSLVSELESRAWSVAHESSAPQPDEPDGLAVHLKTGTRKSHKAAENVHFVRKFIKGQIDRVAYQTLVVSLWHTYRALEAELRAHTAHSLCAPLHFPRELERTAALEADLAYFFGEEWRTHAAVVAPPSPATAEYVARLHIVGRTKPALLIAHAYTRYLGDLSGGRVLARVAKKAMSLADGGLAFYEFEHVSNPKTFKNAYRAALDGLAVAPALADEIVEEANLAFVLNMRVFMELDVLAGDAASVPSTSSVLAGLAVPTAGKKKAECPFAGMGPGFPAKRTNATVAGVGGAQCPVPGVALLMRQASSMGGAIVAAGAVLLVALLVQTLCEWAGFLLSE
jgi:heme oxygenase